MSDSALYVFDTGYTNITFHLGLCIFRVVAVELYDAYNVS